MKNRIVSVFPNSDLRCSHRGLTKVAYKARKDPALLKDGSFLLFLNRAQSAFKMYAASNVLVHYKSPRGRVDIRTIEHLPNCFNGGKLDYDKALETVLKKNLTLKGVNP